MAERLHKSEPNVQTPAPPVREHVHGTASELPPKEIIKRLRALPERQGRLIEVVEAIRKAS